MDPTPLDPNDQSLRLGKRALERGLITPEQLRTALSHHAHESAPAGGATPRLAAILKEKGYITSKQLDILLQEEKAFSTASVPGLPSDNPSASPRRPAQHLGTFGKFDLLNEVGRGGMGVVYEAFDKDLDRRVALKLLLVSPNANAEEAALDEERFIREARLSAKLTHPRVVSVYEAGVINSRRYIAMEFVEGQSLSDWRRAGSVTVRQLVVILRDIALALHDAHEKGIIHRDLKPGNVLIDARNEPHVTDFGLAKFVGQNVAQSFTAEGRVVGTPTYMSPEQVRGSKTIDRRTDIYSLGVMLYEILTGRLPFEGETAMEIMMKAVNTQVKAPSKITTLQMNPLVFTALEAICLKAMAKEPEDRYPDARKLADDLSCWLASHKVRVSSRKLRRRLALVAGTAALLLIAGWFSSRLPQLRPSPAIPAPVASSPPAPPMLPVPKVRSSVVFDAGRLTEEGGLRLRTSQQHDCRMETIEGKAVARPLRDGQPGFLLLDVDDAWAAATPMAEIDIEFFDAGPAWSNFAVEYDSMDGRWAHDGTYKRAGLVVLEGTRKWRSITLVLTCPRFENRMDLASDLRFATDRADILVHRVELRPWSPAPAYSGLPAVVETPRLRPGLLGEYHVDIHLADPRKKSVDLDLVFDWQNSAWQGGPADLFSIRWTGGFRVPRKGRYVLDVQSDDGARVFLGGRSVVSNWTHHAPTTDAAVCQLEAGYYPVQVEFFEEGGGAYLRVAWFEEREGRMWPVDPPPFFHLAAPDRK